MNVEMMEYFPVGVVFFNRQTNVLHANQKMKKLLKISRRAEIQEVDRILRACLSTLISRQDENEWANEEIVMQIDHAKRWFVVSGKRIFDQEKNLLGELMVFQAFDEIGNHQKRMCGSQAMYDLDGIISENAQMMERKAFVLKIAKHSSSVLILGEGGTGKRIFAQAIHNASMRKDSPFVVVNCGAIPADLMERDLFGFEVRGDGELIGKVETGKLEMAAGGTLFLDGVENLPLHVQLKLVGAIKNKTLTRIGGKDVIPLNVRLVSSSKIDLQKETKTGNFSEDLYACLGMMKIHLPPLRERGEDLALLVNVFVAAYAEKFEKSEMRISEGFMRGISHYCWPGNVAELKHAVERAIFLAGKERILEERHLPEKVRRAYEYKSLKDKVYGHWHAVGKEGGNLLKTGEELIIEMVLKEEKGNLKKAACRLGISRPTLYKKINNSHKLTQYKESLQEENEE